MQNPMYISILGKKQGLITTGAFTQESIGTSWQEGHENTSIVKGYSHNVTIPRDPLSGQPSGQRVHSPLTITKLLDKASPLLMSALVDGETLTQVDLRQYRTDAFGKLEWYYGVRLEDAIIVDINSDAPHVFGEFEKDVAPLEHVSFSYRKIMWSHERAVTSAEDDWRKGVGA